MTATQTQIRRDTDANLMASTPALAELGYNQTTKRLHLGDGSTAGGTITPNAADTQLSSFAFAVAGGTGNAITVSLPLSPGSYAQPLRVQFRASNTNTGATTINVNSIGTRNIYKFSAGALVALAAGDIVSGGIYEIVYDGTQFQLLNNNQSGLISVSQGDLATSTGTFSASTGILQLVTSGRYMNSVGDSTIVTLPGGEYGFHIISAQSIATSNNTAGWIAGRRNSSTNAACVWPFVLSISDDAVTVKGQQRYITSSPPFDLGDGEAGGFIFLLMDGNNVVSTYMADVPPWGYNGPTDIRCTHKCLVTGKKFRRVMKKRSLEQIMDNGRITYEMQEITQKIKNADMGLIPHPFGDVEGKTVVLLDPMDTRVANLIEYQNAGGDISTAFSDGLIYADNESLKRSGPKGVMQCKLRFKNGRS